LARTRLRPAHGFGPHTASARTRLRPAHGFGSHTASGKLPYIEGVELLWIKLKLGTCIPHLPTTNFLDTETILPGAASQSFWLKGSAWQFPNFETPTRL